MIKKILNNLHYSDNNAIFFGMKLMSFLVRFFVMASLLMLSKNDVKAELPLSSITQFDWDKKGETPLLGPLGLYSGVLRNIRFFGNYGPYNKKYLCHREISNPIGDHESTATKDSPQDYTTAIIQHFFPSPTRGHLTLPGPSGDFFKRISLKDLKSILDIYNKYANKKDSDGALKEFQELFDALFKENMNGSNRQEIAKLWAKSFNMKAEKKNYSSEQVQTILDTLSKTYANFFAGAIKEQKSYPQQTVQAAILALMWKRAKNVDDLPFSVNKKSSPRSKRL